MFFLFVLDLFARLRYTQDLPDLVHNFLFQVYLFVSRRRHLTLTRRPPPTNNITAIMEALLNNKPSSSTASATKTPAANDLTSNMM